MLALTSIRRLPSEKSGRRQTKSRGDTLHECRIRYTAIFDRLQFVHGQASGYGQLIKRIAPLLARFGENG